MYKDTNYYTIFKKDGIFTYACYTEDGKRVQRSTGKRKKGEAIAVINDRIAQGRLAFPVGYVPRSVLPPKRSSNPTFMEYSEDFYVFDRCPIIRDSLARGGHFSKDFAKICRQNLEKHILPAFGSHLITDITQAEVNTWLLNLPSFAGISPSTANKVYRLLKDIMARAKFDGLIKESPCENVKNLKGMKKNERHSFSREEVSLILNSSHFRFEMSRLACRIAASTGMRKSEIRALRPDHVFDDHICVEFSFSSEMGLKCTKCDYVREVPISRELHDAIVEYARPLNLPPDGFIFSLNGTKPVNEKFFNKDLDIVMEKEGITRNGLVFHSFRYFVNSELVSAGIPLDVVQSVIGHSSDEMTEHYFDIPLKRKKDICMDTLGLVDSMV